MTCATLRGGARVIPRSPTVQSPSFTCPQCGSQALKDSAVAQVLRYHSFIQCFTFDKFLFLCVKVIRFLFLLEFNLFLVGTPRTLYHVSKIGSPRTLYHVSIHLGFLLMKKMSDAEVLCGKLFLWLFFVFFIAFVAAT